MDRLVTDLLLADASALVELVRPKSHSKGVASAFCEAVAAAGSVGMVAATVTPAVPTSDALQRSSSAPCASAMYGRRSSATSIKKAYSTGCGSSDQPTLLRTDSVPGPGAKTAGGGSQRSTEWQHERLFGAT